MSLSRHRGSCRWFLSSNTRKTEPARLLPDYWRNRHAGSFALRYAGGAARTLEQLVLLPPCIQFRYNAGAVFGTNVFFI